MAGTDPLDRILRLEDQRSALGSSIQDLIAAAQAIGLDANVMRRAVTLRRQELAEHASHRDVLDIFDEAVGIRMHESWF